MSGDRTTRAAVTLSLTGAPVNVVIAQRAPHAVSRLQEESIDAVVVDAATVSDVPSVVGAVETHAPGSPTFVHWGSGDDAVVSEVVTGSDTGRDDATDRLATLLRTRLEADADPPLEASSTASDDASPSSRDGPTVQDPDLPEELAAALGAVRCRLLDVRSPGIVERIVREEWTALEGIAFAWIGEYDRGEREIVPWLTDPDATSWPLGRTFSVGDGTYPLLDEAIETTEPRTATEALGDAPLGATARERGVASTTVVPLASSERVYGVLMIYADEALSDADERAIRSLADAVSAVLETIAVHGRLDQQERARQRYERLVQTAGDGMYVLDDQGHFTTVNDALVEMTGYEREALLGEHASILFDEDDIDAARSTIRSLLDRDAATDTVEMTLETKSGQRVPTEAQIAILVHRGLFHGSVGVIRDITERKRNERQLRERNERLDAFASIVSHDLRNPLSVAQGYLDLIEQTGSIEHVPEVRGGLDRMESIVDNVLTIARDGDWTTDVEPLDLESIADEAWDHVATEEASLSVDGSVGFEGDRSSLLRLFENLFRNAMEHGDADVIRVGPFEDGRRGFYVADDGDGLPPDVRDDLFDPSVSTGSDGLGIGLWIVSEVATGHGWTITATESENGGARFEFAFDD
uniref:PAS domain S-box protein n=1 Tax=Halopiger goleimassiliensis TaxID=1293048 RepID=UPI00373FD8AE